MPVPFIRTDLDFLSRGTRCAAWLYRPSDMPGPPVVIMAHGFGAERDFRLPAFAERFAAAGMAVLLFDYRTFGASAGQPRNLISPWRQVQDWKAAIHCARQRDDVDASRMALWGTSYSGGHVIVAAAADPAITAIVAQVPMVDPIATIRRLGTRYAVRGLWAGLRDELRHLTFRRPLEVPIYGPPGTLACLATADSVDGYRSMIPADSVWQNSCPARCLLSFPLYRPRAVAVRVRCPALLIAAEHDTLIPPGSVRKTAQRMAAATLLALPLGHFSVYHGPAFETVVAAEIEFFQQHLGLPGTR